MQVAAVERSRASVLQRQRRVATRWGGREAWLSNIEGIEGIILESRGEQKPEREPKPVPLLFTLYLIRRTNDLWTT